MLLPFQYIFFLLTSLFIFVYSLTLMKRQRSHIFNLKLLIMTTYPKIDLLMTTEQKFIYLESLLEKSGCPTSEITPIASQIIIECKNINKSVLNVKVVNNEIILF